MKNNYSEQYILKSPPGFTIVEVMMAVTVLAVGMMGAISLINYSIFAASNSINRITAANLSEEGIELVRNVRDSNWLAGDNWDKDIKGNGAEKAIKFFCGGAAKQNISESDIDNCSPPNGSACQVYVYKKISDNSLCYSDNFSAQAGYTIEKQTGFYRLIKLDRLSAPAERIQVSAYIKWMDRNGQYRYLTAEEILYNWR